MAWAMCKSDVGRRLPSGDAGQLFSFTHVEVSRMIAPMRRTLIALAATAVACDRAAPTRERAAMQASVAATSMTDVATPAAAPPAQLSSVAARAKSAAQPPASTWADQKLIRTADLRIEAKDVGATLRL